MPGEKRQLRAELGLKEDQETLLVLGGSQGSHRINLEFMKAIPLLKESLDFQVIHISGRKDYEDLKSGYARAGVECRLFDFLEDMGKAYQAADMVVGRAGALTVLEIARFQRPAVLIPYPFAGGHQRENAGLLCRAGLAEMIEEKDLSASRLAEAVRRTVGGRPLKPREKERIERELKDIFVPEADQRLAEEIIALGKGPR
jgi:UDP-N-acetylglucosamine--N-acetylmuramyl-(pentapeptide) pyrophosphoryl-undecaprenol N-acetylglucosamine transferase